MQFETSSKVSRAIASFEETADHLPIGVLVLDAKGTCAYMSQRACSLLCAEKADAVGKPWIELFRAEGPDVRESLSSSLGKETAADLPIGPKDSRKWIRFGSSPLTEPDGTVSGFVIALGDVTEPKRELSESDAARDFLHRVLDSLPLALFVKEPQELRFISWNKATEQLTGLERKDVVGKNDFDFFTPSQAAFFTDKDREILGSGKAQFIEREPICRKDGETRILRTWKVPVFDGEGNPLYLIGLSEDITETVRAAEEQRMAKALYEQLMDAIPEMVVVRDRDLRVVKVNRAYLDFAGVAFEEIIGAQRLPTHDDELTQMAIKLSARVINVGEAVHVPKATLIARDGRKASIEIRGYPNFDPSGRITGVIAMFREISPASPRDGSADV